MRLQSLPRCRAAPARARGAAVLGWCSPQSSVPRQTVGHHARAAMYEMGLTAACEGRRGEVPRLCLDIPPTGACLFLSHIPTGRGAVGPTARRALGWISQSRKTQFVCVLLKMGSRARKSAFAHHEPRGEARGRQIAARVLGTTQYTNTAILSLFPGRPLLCPLLSHIPTGRGAVAATARRALGWISQSRKTRSYGLC